MKGNGKAVDILECHDATVKDGIKSLVLPAEVESTFGKTNVDHFISFFNETNQNLWNSVAYFYGRYLLTMQVKVQIDYNDCTVTKALAPAEFTINEVIEVERMETGQVSAAMQGQWRFTASDWKRFLKSKDWSTIGVPIRTNAPVSGFEKFVAQARAPIQASKANRLKKATPTERPSSSRTK